jgi:deoxyxylulose-5-phosphate synthase
MTKRIDGIGGFSQFHEIYTALSPPFPFVLNHFKMALCVHFPKSASIHARLPERRGPMTCKVVRLVERDHLVVLRISGPIQEAHVSLIEELIAKETDPVVLDLAEVTPVDREAIGFIATCDVRGIRLRNCPGFIEFIHEWMRKVETRELRQLLRDRDEAAADGSTNYAQHCRC